MARCSCCNNVKVLIGVLLLSCVLFIVSLVLAFVVFPDVIDGKINEATRLEEGTEQWDRFVELPFPLIFKVYVFNVNNADEIILNGAKPSVSEKGPYVYKQYRKKTIIDKNDEEDTVSYTQLETFEFDAEASGSFTEDDLVTVLNPPLMSIYHLSEEFQLSGAVDRCITQTFPDGYGDVFITVPVKNLLFEGFNFCKNEGTGSCSLVNNIVCKIASTKRNTDILPDYSLQFSFLNYKRRSHDGKYTVKRGLDEIDTLGNIVAWEDMKYTNYWGESTICSEVRGTDSTLYPPRITTDNKFFIFSTDICRAVEINYIRETSYKDIDGYLFGTSAATLRSSTETPEDDCFCSKLSKNAEGEESCFLDGIIDMQTCFGVPVLFSFPHFLWADSKYSAGVDGLNASEDYHKTYLIVEPNTGSPLEGVKRIQLNGIIRPILGISSLNNTKGTVIPLLWIEEGFQLSDKYVEELQTTYFDQIHIVDGIRWTLIAVTALLTVVFGGLTIRKRFSKQNTINKPNH